MAIDERYSGSRGASRRSSPILWVIFLISIIALLNCGTSEKTEEREDVKYEMRHFEKVFGVCDSTSQACLTITADYPEFMLLSAAPAFDSLNEFVTALLLPRSDSGARDADLETFSRNMYAEYRQLLEEFPEYAQPWFISKEILVVTDTANLLVMRYYESSYTGGAHPNSSQQYANFDTRTGRRIILDDIMIEGYLQPLTDTAEVIFRAARNLSPSDNLGEAGFWFDNNSFALNDNIGIVATGLIVYYNSYEIAPYAAGPTRLLIPYDKIRHLILDDGPLGFAK